MGGPLTLLLNAYQPADSRGASQALKNDSYTRAMQVRKDYAPEKIDDFGYNELHWAVLCNQSERVSEIVQGKLCDINVGTEVAYQSDEYGWPIPILNTWNITPVMFAILHRNYPVITILLENGASLFIKTIKYERLVGISDHSHTEKGPNPIDVARGKSYQEIFAIFNAHAEKTGDDSLKSALAPKVYDNSVSLCSLF